LSNEVAYRGALCFNVAEHVTLVGELLGRRVGQAGRIISMRAPHPTILNVDTIRLVPENTSVSTAATVVGAKWNIAGTWILAGHVMLPMTGRGLRSGPVTLIGLDYAFGQ
jgi:hypothetical protein